MCRNPATEQYAKVEGIHQVAADGSVTYYIKTDKKSRNAERIYLHEKFHNIVENNPELLPDLVKALDERYGRQEVAALINSYVEAYDGIYGRFEEGMTEEQQRALEQEYMNEVFADVYADIQRGRKSVEKAKKIMDDQTDAVQRAAQNRKVTENKNAPPKQRFSIEDVVEGEKGTYQNCVLLNTDIFNHINPRNWGKVLGEFVYKNLAGQKLTMFDEDGNAETVEIAKTNDRVQKVGAKHSHKVIDELARYKGDNMKALATVHLSELQLASTDESRSEERSHQWMDENGWIYRHVYVVNRDGVIYDALLNIADGRDRRIIYTVNNIRAIDKRKGTAHGVVPSTDNGRGSHIKSSSSTGKIPQSKTNVKQNFSADDDAAELDEGYARKMAEPEERQGKDAPEWEAVAKKKRSNAQRVKSSALKNQIKRTQEELAIQRATIRQLKKDGLLTKETKEAIEARMEDIKETLEIQKGES